MKKILVLQLKKPQKFYLLDKVTILDTCFATNYKEAYALFKSKGSLNNITSFGICYWRVYNLCHKLM